MSCPVRFQSSCKDITFWTYKLGVQHRVNGRRMVATGCRERGDQGTAGIEGGKGIELHYHINTSIQITQEGPQMRSQTLLKCYELLKSQT